MFGELQSGKKAAHVSDGKTNAGAFSCGRQFLALLRIHAQWLLYENMLSCIEQLQTHRRM